MDQGSLKNIPCKVTIVNEFGEVILDTLVNDNGERIRSCAMIHGIREYHLNDAPSRDPIYTHIMEICKDSIFVGHSVKYDLKVMGIANVQFIDTSTLEDQKQPQKLRALAREKLNAKIQNHLHSSVIDARASMAIFMQKKDQFAEMIQYLSFEDIEDSGSKSYKKRLNRQRKELSFLAMSQTFHGKSNQRVIPEDFKKVYFSKINDEDLYTVNLEEIKCKKNVT
ncbi:rna exonuclease 4 [Stylonychia lemnae]|uniref:Rna exonuclease 4 n=1 Tax=Stylonychia lemnae TaxID=5949 RepID=A0A078A1J6_STYLE|nr:rna exonuclease 4 [Stylonychia lemnae]|eukprot:CDW76131.1 rna exonuclease 4 [Stylonychia lemnae]